MRSRVTAADRANHLWQKGSHDMHNEKPRPHGSVTSQRAAGSEELFRGASNPPDINNQDDEQAPVAVDETQLAKEIRVYVEKGDKARDKAEQYYIAAGLHLKKLRDHAPSKADWEELIKNRCGLGTSRAYELIQIADGRKTVADVRSAKAQSMRKLRSRPPRGGQSLPAVAEPEQSGERYLRPLATTPKNREQLDHLAHRLIHNDLEAARELYQVLCKDDDLQIQHLILALANGIEVEEKGKLNDGGDSSVPTVPDDGLGIPDYLRRTPKKAAAS